MFAMFLKRTLTSVYENCFDMTSPLSFVVHNDYWTICLTRVLLNETSYE